MKVVINAENQVLGRLSAYAAKQALLGNTVIVVNSEKAVVSGSKRDILRRYKQKKARGVPAHGPFFPKKPEAVLRRTIRGMLPHRQAKGRKAFARIRCYSGIPENVSDSVKVGKGVEKLSSRYITLKKICEAL